MLQFVIAFLFSEKTWLSPHLINIFQLLNHADLHQTEALKLVCFVKLLNW